MRIVRYLFLVHIACIVLLHALVPHTHHAEMTKEQHRLTHQEAENLFDYFGLVFQEGLESSLEHIVMESQMKIDFPSHTDFDSCGLQVSIDEHRSLFSVNLAENIQSNNLFHQTLQSLNGLRAPPL